MTHLKLLILQTLIGLSILGCQSNSAATVSDVPEVRITGAPIDSPAKKDKSVPNSNSSGLKIAPTDPAARALLAAEAPKPEARAGYESVTFLELSSFPYPTDEDGKLLAEAVLPEAIAKLDKQNVAVSGFMVPIEFQEDKVSSLILVRNQLLCCYGEEPQLNEWIFVNIKPPVESITDVPVTLFGKLYASPDEEDGQTISLYRMDASQMKEMD